MVRPFGRPLLLMVALLAALAVAASSWAQAGGTIRGVVRDVKGQPVEGAQVTIRMPDTGRTFTSKTNRRGEYLQIGLATGQYEVFAEKEKLKSAVDRAQTKMGATTTVDITLGAAAAGGGDAEARVAALKASFEEGVALSSAGNHDAAIAKFQEAITANPNCGDCYVNIGYSHMQKKEYEQAEAAYKKATEVAPNSASGYNGLANLYNAQRKFDLAAEASTKATQLAGGSADGAAGGGSADAHYNQGVILWNSGKIPEAKKSFEAAVAADPKHAEAHFQLGMALVNEGNMAGAATEFETYLQLSPSGQNAATAKSLVEQLKK